MDIHFVYCVKNPMTLHYHNLFITWTPMHILWRSARLVLFLVSQERRQKNEEFLSSCNISWWQICTTFKLASNLSLIRRCISQQTTVHPSSLVPYTLRKKSWNVSTITSPQLHKMLNWAHLVSLILCAISLRYTLNEITPTLCMFCYACRSRYILYLVSLFFCQSVGAWCVQIYGPSQVVYPLNFNDMGTSRNGGQTAGTNHAHISRKKLNGCRRWRLSLLLFIRVHNKIRWQSL